MANQIMRYETILVFNNALGEEAVSALVQKFKTLIADNAEIEKIEEWGKRQLAYPIDDENEGYYLLLQYECKPDFPAELNRVLEITEGVLRSLIIRNECERKPEPEPEAAAQEPETQEPEVQEPEAQEAAPSEEKSEQEDAPAVEDAAAEQPAPTEEQ